MKKPHIAKFAAAPALLLLAACGQDTAVENEAVADETEMSATGTSASGNRDWMPAGVALPSGHTVIQDTKIGMRTYLLQASVPNDPKSEFPGWKSALEAAGYQVNDGMLSDGRLLFDGGNVESGQISVSQPEDVEGYMIQIDVTQTEQ
ncbi:hypothetical protein [Sphingopyxis witflariensis]|uniref:Lipoprotein n=1 Tax=Sphingopyxis witflariensis TaxID=173675 RepID=A0A246JU50_9SPHN|nr:hypothetical protein [Sphingopyxis witflariensis]OWQ96360.1 hypothetical protein CDQ91_12740 [Sphingopyxis witflariensis]